MIVQKAKPGSKHNKTVRMSAIYHPWREHNLDGLQKLLVSDRVVWSLPSDLIHETALKKKKKSK